MNAATTEPYEVFIPATVGRVEIHPIVTGGCYVVLSAPASRFSCRLSPEEIVREAQDASDREAFIRALRPVSAVFPVPLAPAEVLEGLAEEDRPLWAEMRQAAYVAHRKRRRSEGARKGWRLRRAAQLA